MSNHLQQVEIHLANSCPACHWPLKTSSLWRALYLDHTHFQNNSVSLGETLKITARYISSYICQGKVARPDPCERWTGSQTRLGFELDTTNIKMCSFCVQPSIQIEIIKKEIAQNSWETLCDSYLCASFSHWNSIKPSPSRVDSTLII